MTRVGEAPELATPLSSAAAPVLDVQRLSVRFGKQQAVRSVSFQLRAGDLLGLIGPNGAGKTTLLRSICGLQTISGGALVFLNESLSPERDDLLSQIGFTPDVAPVYDHLTVRQFLRFIGQGYNLSGRDTEERISFWLEKVWLTEKADAKIKNLSRGMKQRVGIARTLLPNPALILLDEPAAGLDPAGRVQFRQLLCDLRDQGKVLIVSSHILSDMADYCTHVGIMSAGRLMKFGTVSQVANMHGDDRCRYTVRLVQAVPQLETLLQSVPEVTNVAVDRLSISLEYLNTPEAAADLLKQLLSLRLSVCGFSAHAADLEQAYLRTGIGQVN